MSLFSNEELHELFDRRRELEERKNNYFGDDEEIFEGDRGYQELWEQLDEVNEQINEIED